MQALHADRLQQFGQRRLALAFIFHLGDTYEEPGLGHVFAQQRIAVAFSKQCLKVLFGPPQQFHAERVHAGFVFKVVLAETCEQVVHSADRLGQVSPRFGQCRRGTDITDQNGQHRNHSECGGDGDPRGGNRVATAPAPRPLDPIQRPGNNWTAFEVAAQIVRQRGGRSVSSRRLFLQAFQANRFQVAVERRVELPRRDRFLRGDLPDRLHQAGGLERWTPGQQMIERRAHRIDISRRGDTGRIHGLLGRHVRRRSQDFAGMRDFLRFAHELRQPKVR